MNVFEVVFTPQAEEQQLEDIAHYIAAELRNPIAAEKFIDDLVGESLKRILKKQTLQPQNQEFKEET